ncbi:MAG: Kelch repeat-containing protein, partial [Planctomycetota bacterium]
HDYEGQDLGVSLVGWPSWSPDGTKILFHEDVAHITVINLDGTGRQVVPIESGYVAQTSWSPTGTAFVYNRRNSGASYTSDLWIYDFTPPLGEEPNIMNGNNIRLTQGASSESTTKYAPDWTPSGNILFMWGHNIAIIDPGQSPNWADPSNPNVTFLTNDGTWPSLVYGYPSWSPDLSQVVYDYWTSQSPEAHLWIMDASGQNGYQLPIPPGSIPDWGNPPPPCEWVLLDGELNIPRHALTGEALDGYIYAIGGVVNPGSPSDAQNAVSKYDPATDSWTLVASMPTARHSLSSAVIDGWIYAVGGHVANSRSENQRYNGTSWESKASVYARSGPGVAAYNGELYVFGGNHYATMLSRFDIYNPTTNTWRIGGDIPAAGEPWRAVTLGDRIYIGTIHMVPAGDEIWCYNPVGGTWDTSLPKFNVPRWNYEMVVANGRIYAIGGGNTSGYLSSVESWALGATSWRMEPSLNIARSGFASTVIGNDIYVFGGYDGSDLGSTEVLKICEPQPEPLPDIHVSPTIYDFGDVAIGSAETLLVSITNTGDADLTLTSLDFQAGSSSDFSITSAPALPATVPPAATVDVEITFSPSILYLSSATLDIGSDDADESLVEVSLSGVGVWIEPPPDEQIEDIMDFIDESVEDGNLAGDGPGNSADKRLNALINMIEAAGDLIDDGLYEEAHQQLEDAYKKCDGQTPPPDFVSGPAASELAERIQNLMQIIKGAVVVTVDGLSFANTLLGPPYLDDTDHYLKTALEAMEFLTVSDSVIDSFPWSRDAGNTDSELLQLRNFLKNSYDTARDEGKKFVVVSHSWGTFLSYLALSYESTVEDPIYCDLYITLSSPMGTYYAHDSQYLEEIAVTGYVNMWLAALDFASCTNCYPRTDACVNVWAWGDVIS